MFKNLAKDRELEGDVLRQRRDLYATSLGLILFHLAGAGLRDEAVLTTVPVHLSHPAVLYWAACAALLYFLFRYWMVAPNALERFNEEWKLQTLASGKYRDLIQQSAAGHVEDANQLLGFMRSGTVPECDWNTRAIQWNQMRNLKRGGEFVVPGYIRMTNGGLITDDQRDTLGVAIRRGFFRAVFFERTAMDIMAPYAVALAAIVVVVYSLI